MTSASHEIRIDRVDGDAFRAIIDGHSLVTDQPLDSGGGDAGPTPTALFVASLASCVAFYAGRALGRDRAHAPLGVRCRWSMSAEPPHRVTSIELSVDLPPGVGAQRIAAVERAVQHCTVHNTLLQPPEITLTVAGASAAA